ncbi:MAG: NAD-dependent epimerase/dehydratase family protein, partial [Planctomycetota bacterium]|nr:NAD-dependent epimerase/dehydratase family protein [Planctomycetota bacterium]
MTDLSAANGGACLVTGGAGFIGSHLAGALLASGRRVVALDDLSSGRIENISHLQSDPRFRFVRADAEDRKVIEDAGAGCRIIFHLAAVVGVRAAIETPARAIMSNIACCEAALEAARRLGCRVVLASSSEVYGRGRGVPLREEDGAAPGPPEIPRWSYAAGKLACEYMAMAYFRQYGVEVAIARLFNVIGPRQSDRYGMVVPTLVRQALRGEPMTV